MTFLTDVATCMGNTEYGAYRHAEGKMKPYVIRQLQDNITHKILSMNVAEKVRSFEDWNNDVEHNLWRNHGS